MADSSDDDKVKKSATTAKVSVGGSYPVSKITGGAQPSGEWATINFDLQHTRPDGFSLALDSKAALNGPSKSGSWNLDNVPNVSGAIGLTAAQRLGGDTGPYAIGAGGLVVSKTEALAPGAVNSGVQSALSPLRDAYARIDAGVRNATQLIADAEQQAIRQIQLQGLPPDRTNQAVAQAESAARNARLQVTEQTNAALARLPNLNQLETDIAKAVTVNPKAELSVYGAVVAGFTTNITQDLQGDVSVGVARTESLTGQSHGTGFQLSGSVGNGLKNLPKPLPPATQGDVARSVTVSPGKMQGGDWQVNPYYRQFENQRNGSLDLSIQNQKSTAFGATAMVAVSGKVAFIAGVEHSTPTTRTPDALTPYVNGRATKNATEISGGVLIKF